MTQSSLSYMTQFLPIVRSLPMAKRRKGPMTAEELLNELESDPEWVTQRDTREREHALLEAETAKHERALVEEIREVGYKIESVWDLVNNAPHPVLKRNFVGPYEGAYSVLIHHLKLPYVREVREGIIRALTVKDGGPELEAALLAELDNEPDPALKWVLGNALRTAMPYHRRQKYPQIKEALNWSH
jgi:hypothetical protein